VLTAWRIAKARHAAHAFDGEGAWLAGGRWNSPGLPCVYTASHTALAALEMLVHLAPRAALPAYVLIACTFDERLVLKLDRSRLPAHWRAYPAPSRLQLLGDAWLKDAPSAVLDVPNAIIASESNYLLNPRHPDFGAIAIGDAKPFDFDLRLLRGVT
jgi:RES domain-containing protein